MNLIALPAFTDNCIWMFHDGREAVVVDPGDAAPVFAALTAHWISLVPILVTHHPGDPVDAVDVSDHTSGPIALFHDGNAEPPLRPAPIAGERFINPLLRCAEPAVAQAAQQHAATSRNPVDVFAALRQWKSRFR